MKHSSHAKSILTQITAKTKLGDLRKIAKDIKRDHELSMELWSTNSFLLRQLAILIMDNKLLSQDLIKHIFSKIPKGEEITIVAIKNIDNLPHLAVKETVISTQEEVEFTFKPITMKILKNEMKKFDRFN